MYIILKYIVSYYLTLVLVTIKTAMDNIENELLEFKTKQRDEYASLHVDMNSLFQELSFYNDRINQWETSTVKIQKINQNSQIVPPVNLYSNSPILKRMHSVDKNSKIKPEDDTSELIEANLPDKLVAELRTLEDKWKVAFQGIGNLKIMKYF